MATDKTDLELAWKWYKENISEKKQQLNNCDNKRDNFVCFQIIFICSIGLVKLIPENQKGRDIYIGWLLPTAYKTPRLCK